MATRDPKRTRRRVLEAAIATIATIAGTASIAKTSQNIAQYQASFRATERSLDSLRA